MRNLILLFGGLFFLLVLNACHRPYAVVQRTPLPRFKSPEKEIAIRPTPADSAAEAPTLAQQTELVDSPEPVTELAFASTAPVVAAPAARAVAHRVKRIESILRESEQVAPTQIQPRPRPKNKNDLRLGNRIRQGLGLPLREELNWWQRIDWKLKSAVFVIGVAIVFAVLGLGQLALLFGLIGAILLVLGLKRSFKKRRPWL